MGTNVRHVGTEPVSIVLVDDHSLVREGLRNLLDGIEGFTVVGEAATVAEGVAVIEGANPDIVLLDLRLDLEEGLDVLREMRERGSDVKVLVLSVHDAPRHLRAALAAGADGYLLKSARTDQLADGIRATLAGETVIADAFVGALVADLAAGGTMASAELTPREQEVLELVAQGLSNRHIGERLGISLRTAQKHVERLLSKLGVHDRTELVAVAFRRGLIS